jgi:glycosyltransferase involved in cell wall biosynthesis
MKKKILIVIPGFNHGGTNRSLSNLLSLIDDKLYDISVFGMSPDGYYRDMLSNYNILNGNYILTALMSNVRKEKFFFVKFFFILIKLLNKILLYINLDIKKSAQKHIVNKHGFENYDTIIAFQEGEATSFVSKVKCANKIAWIHCNYAEYLKYLNIAPEKIIYSKFKSIVCVSDYTKNIFSDLIPELKDNVFSIHNTIDSEFVKAQSKDINLDNIFKKNIFNIISVGRFDVSKRFSVIPEIAFQLKNKGFIFKWFLIGGVTIPEEKIIFFNNIKKYGVEDYIEYLGEVDNPYPYIANSNLLVSTSISEAFPYVLIEAKTLGIPVAVTDFGSAAECVIDRVEGIITPLEKMPYELENLINNKTFYTKLKLTLSNYEYDNLPVLKTIYEIW